MKKEKGFVYKKVKSRDLRVMEALHANYLYDGWERVSDVTTDFFGIYAICWYRKSIISYKR